MVSGASVASARASGSAAALRRPHALAALGTAGAAACVYVVARHQGGYTSGTWGPLGAALTAALFALLCVGRRPGRLPVVSAGLLFAFGTLGVASVAWGGIPQQAWDGLDLALLGALALLVGQLGFGERPRLAVAAAAAGFTALAIELLVRLALDPPAAWFSGRTVDGPVGYHNAQGILFAVGVALALGELDAASAPVRAAAAAAAAVCLGGLLLTQSRGALAALCAVAVAHVFVRGGLGRLVRVGALAAAGVVLWTRLEQVDASLLQQHPATPALRTFAAATALAAVAAAAVAAVPLPSLGLSRQARLAVSVLAAVVAVGVLAAAVPSARFDALTRQLTSDAAPSTSAGSTRFTSLSLNGRHDAWRVALREIRAQPLLGAGLGSYARAWTRERRLTDLYIRQPHSIFLEVTAGLGAVGLALWVAFLAVLVAAVLRARSLAARSAVLALGALLVEAAVDWTWSFPGIVVPVLLVAGAAAGRPAFAATRGSTVVALVPATVAAAAAFALPWAAGHELQAANAAGNADPARAWQLADRARSLAPTDPDPIGFEGRLAEAEGRYALAATLYGRAADRSQEPWVFQWERARVLRLDRRARAADRACRAAFAENPGEPILRTGPCDGVL